MDCPICLNHMIKPIYTCSNGHSFCSCCNNQQKCPMCRVKLNKIRNITLENLIAASVVRCPYYVQDCNFMSDALSVKKHMEDCEFGTAFECPLKVATSCNWKGLLRDLRYHIIIHRRTAPLGWMEGEVVVRLKYFCDRYFKICRGYFDKVSRISCQYIGAPINASRYCLLIHAFYDNGNSTRRLCPCIPITDIENVFSHHCFPVFGKIVEDPNLVSNKMFFSIVVRTGQYNLDCSYLNNGLDFIMH